MKPYFILVLVALLFTLSCRREVPVDTIFYNGKIFTARTPSEFVEAMAVKDGVIVAVGTTEEMFDAYLPADTTGVDLKNRLVLPGFHDAHLHVWNGAKLQRELDLRGLTSLEAVLQKVREAVAQAPPGEWIIGRGWDHELWATRKLPDRKLLDAISRKHPIYLKRVDGHAAWVNSVVLRLLRYTEHTEDPEGGKIMRYPGTRIPNGILFDAAFELLDKIVPEPTFTQKYELVKSIIEKANRLGVTAVTDNSPLDLYPVYAELQKNQALTWRVNFFISYTENLDSVKAFIARQGEIPHHLQARLMKLYADGSLGSRTAYLKQPYTDAPESVGIPRYSPEALTEMVRRADSAGFQIGIHGIGDAGV
ncbi:MAG: amidohydrolase, partial [Calditrichaeota bacterium]